MVDYWELARQVGGGLILGLILIIVLGVVGVIIWWRRKEAMYKHYRVFIWKRHQDNEGNEIPVIVGWDKGAVRKDKKMKKWVFHLKKWNMDLGEEERVDYDEDRELDLPSVPLEKGGEVVFVEKIGPRKLAVGKPFIFGGNVKVIVSSADVAEAIRAYDINAKTFNKKDSHALLAFTLYIIFAILVLVLIVFILQKFELIQKAAEQFAVGAQSFAQAKGAGIASNAPG